MENIQSQGKENIMAETYEVVSTYTFTQLVMAETAEQAMLQAEDSQPNLEITEALGLVEIDRTANNEPLTASEVIERLTVPAI
jgi:hypothetical protein